MMNTKTERINTYDSMTSRAAHRSSNGPNVIRLLLTPLILFVLALLIGCSSSSSNDNAQPLDDNAQPLDDGGDTRDLMVSFRVPERLTQLGTGLTATVTAGGTEQPMEEVETGFEAMLALPMEQQLQVYIGVRRAEDGLLLAAADSTTWLGAQGAALSVPEQRFDYAYDQDGDGVDNIVEIERGTSPVSISLDFDADGLPDDIDSDDDNDGIADDADVFPFNGQEFEDTDADGIGNNADTDDDDDGVLDDHDAFPADASETRDSDGDGIGDNLDTDADGNGIEDDQEDSDGDGVPDMIDLFPDNSYESSDTDGDGIGDNEDTDDNNNGIEDYREGSQLIIPYVDDASVVVDGIWFTEYSNNNYYNEWAKAADTDSFGYGLHLGNLQIDNTGRNEDYRYNDTYFEVMHDGEYLYVKISVGNEQLENWFNDSADVWEDDSVELYIDVGYDQLDSYGDDDYQRIFRFRDTADDPTLDGYYSASGMETEHVTSYRHENNAESVYQQLYEIRVKLSSIGLEPGDTFGLEVASNDDDDGGMRDTKWGWWAPSNQDVAWFRPRAFGKAKLQPTD